MNDVLETAIRKASFMRQIPIQPAVKTRKPLVPEIRIIPNPPRPGKTPEGKVDWREMSRQYEAEHTIPMISIKHIIEKVSYEFGVAVSDILSPRRDYLTIQARHVAYYLARRLTIHSYPRIGHFFGGGGRDHSTILHGIKKIMQRMEKTPMLKNEVERIEREILQWSRKRDDVDVGTSV